MARRTGNWIEAYLRFTDNTEPPASFREWTAISMIAAALERKVFVRMQLRPTYPNMYIVLVAPPGKGRKSTAMMDGKELLNEIDVNIAPNATNEIALKHAFMSAARSITMKEGNNDLLYIHSSLTVWSSELTTFLTYNARQLLSDITDFFDSPDRHVYKTVGRGDEVIVNMYLNLLGATTPMTLKNALPFELIGGGLSSRIIFVYEENQGNIIPFALPDMHGWEDLKKDLQEIHAMQGEFKLTDKFVEAYSAWYIDMHRNPPFQGNPHFGNYIARRPTHLWKLCMIFSAATRTDMTITAEVMKLALDALHRVERNMPYTFSATGRSKLAEVTTDIMNYIVAKQKITSADLLRNFYRDVDNLTAFEEIIKTLQKMGFCLLSANTKGELIISLNPAFTATQQVGA